MLRRRAKPVKPSSRYDLPKHPQPLTTEGIVANASALANTLPPEDAFEELMGQDEVPPGHIWPIAFARKAARLLG
jgi:hypothetical protein